MNKMLSIKSVSEISDASTMPKIISCKKLDDADSDAATTLFNIDSISPVQKPKTLSTIILIQSKISKQTYTNLENLQTNSPMYQGVEDINLQLKAVQNALVIKVCLQQPFKNQNQNQKFQYEGEQNKIDEICLSEIERISTIHIQFQKMMISEDHLIMQEIKQIMDYFIGITKISLDLSFCSFESPNVTSSISRIMKDMAFINDIEINFTGCAIKDQFMISLITELKHLNLTNLKRVSLLLNQNKIEIECMLFLSNLFEDMVNLNSLQLELKNCGINNKMLSILSYHVSQLKKLKSLHLNFENNQITDEGTYQMCENLFVDDFKLDELSFNFNQNKITNKSAHYLSCLLKSQKTLQKLSLALRNYKLKSSDFDNLGKSLIKMFELKELELDFSFNELDDEFSLMLETSFKSMRVLKRLKVDLSNNQLFKKGAQFLDQLFKSDSMETLEINLSNNKIGRGAGYSLALQIFFSANLRVLKLDLSNNGMNGSSISCLLNQLKNNYSLEELSINLIGNNYHRANVSSLCENLSTNPLLRKITLIPRNLENQSQQNACKLDILESAAHQRHSSILSFLAYKNKLAKHLIGDTFDIFNDLYDD
ncbi:hypothetical protein ABPG72_010688 [Tetrahymena utriculariae]